MELSGHRVKSQVHAFARIDEYRGYGLGDVLEASQPRLVKAASLTNGFS